MAKSGGFDKTKPGSGSNNPRLEELVDVFKIPNEWSQVRFLPEITSYYVFWITTKDKEGNKAKPFPKLCLDYNPETEEFDKEICPYRKNQAGRGQKVYLANAIIREQQENEPRKKPKHSKRERRAEKDEKGRKVYRKHKDSDSWTPVRVIRLPSSLATSLKNLAALNKTKGKPHDITDLKYGADVHLSHDPKIEGTAQYKVQIAEKTRITKDEFGYLRYPIYGLMKPESKSEAKEEWSRIKTRLWAKDDDSSDSDYDSDDRKKRRKKKDKNKKRRKKDQSDLEPSSDAYEDSSDIDLEESSDDKKTSKKKKSKKRSSKKDKRSSKSSKKDKRSSKSSKKDKRKSSKKSKSKDKKRKSKKRRDESSSDPF